MVTGAEVAGATGVQRSLYMKRLHARLLPSVRSGRLGRNDVRQYRAELVSMPIPAWMRSDSERVLAAISRVVEHPNYQYEQSLAGDFGGLGGFFDTIADVAKTVYGAGKQVVSTVVGVAPVVGQVAETITRTAPAVESAWERRAQIVAAAPIVSQVYDVGSTVVGAAQKPVIFGLTPLMLGGMALAAYLLLRR